MGSFEPARSRRVAIAALLAVVVAAGAFASIARADGDPASDVLVSQTVFLPSDACVSAQQQAQLVGLLQASTLGKPSSVNHSGFKRGDQPVTLESGLVCEVVHQFLTFFQA